jgi:hypothetical protein
MKNGFTYSTYCGARQLEGMKKSAEGYWTDKIEVSQITSEEYQKAWWSETELSLDTKSETPQKAKKKLPKFANLEDFFGEDNGTGHSVPPKEKGRNKKADTVKKVRARKQT